MLSKNQIKRIQSLARKKGRREEGCFIAEGNKLVEDTLSVFECDLILATRLGLFRTLTNRCLRYRKSMNKRCRKSPQLVTPPDVLAVYRIPEYHLNIETLKKKELVLALDTVQDPGNLGTIVRLADWFGIRHIVCSPDTADLYNPKVVQATMGALARVKVYYTSLPDFLSGGFVGRVWYISRWGGYLSYLFDEIGGNCDGGTREMVYRPNWNLILGNGCIFLIIRSGSLLPSHSMWRLQQRLHVLSFVGGK